MRSNTKQVGTQRIAWRIKPMACLLVGMFLFLSACRTLQQTAPPVRGMIAHMPDGASHLKQLEHGRSIYLTQCTTCHAPEPVRDYLSDEWSMILPEMAEESRLTSEELAALTAYVELCVNP